MSDAKAIQVSDDGGQAIEALVMRGDIASLPSRERAAYYVQLCRSLGLNPLTQPIKFIVFQGKMIAYFSRDATDQLAATHRLNREIVAGPEVRDFCGHKLLYALCRATHPNGRVETATSLVPIPSGGGEALANAVMKTETKGRRRATLAILGLGFPDESELDTMAGARRLSHAEAMGQLPANVATDAAPPPANVALDAVRDRIADLAGLPTLEQAAGIYCDERPALGVEDAAEAHALLMSILPPGTPKAALNRAIKAEKARRDAPPPSDDPPPSGGGAPRPDADSADAVMDAEIRAAEAERDGAAARATVDAWRTHAATKTGKHELAASFWKREREFARLGVRDDCLAIAADLLMPMLGTDSRIQAINFVVAQANRRRAA